MGELNGVITLSNSIIGVSILAMPFCFRQCGIILAPLMLYLSGLLVKATSYFLLKSAMLARRRNYEVLALSVFGSAGKVAVEVCMTGFMFGTCVTFFVVVGDLAPPILSTYLNVADSNILRAGVIIATAFFVVLPLSLLRNLDSLLGFCAASIGFYAGVMVYIMSGSIRVLILGRWWDNVNKWRPAGIFQCLPIFCMALSCQPQLFSVYETLPDPSLSRMVEVVKGAVNLCSGVYLSVGFFGYLSFMDNDFGGNILTAYQPSFTVDLVKLGFVLAVAVSFPLVIFPCRTSIHSLLYRKAGMETSSELAANYIPPRQFNYITLSIILTSMMIAIQVQDIELVLGILGSTVGTVICILLPVSMFSKLVHAETTERLLAQAIFVIGIILMVLGTYVTLIGADAKLAVKPVEHSLADPGTKFGLEPNIPETPPPTPVGAVVHDEGKSKDSAQKGLKEGFAKDPANPEGDHAVAATNEGRNERPSRKEPALPEAPENSKNDVQDAPPRNSKIKGDEDKNEAKKAEKPPRKKTSKIIIEKLEEQKAMQEKLIQQQEEVLRQLRNGIEDQTKIPSGRNSSSSVRKEERLEAGGEDERRKVDLGPESLVVSTEPAIPREQDNPRPSPKLKADNNSDQVVSARPRGSEATGAPEAKEGDGGGVQLIQQQQPGGEEI